MLHDCVCGVCVSICLVLVLCGCVGDVYVFVCVVCVGHMSVGVWVCICIRMCGVCRSYVCGCVGVWVCVKPAQKSPLK